MRQIDLENWPRRRQFSVFKTWAYPHFNMCADIDMTSLRAFVKKQNTTFTVAIVYVLTRAANNIPEFRTRIRGEVVVEHEIVHPSCTILVDGNQFSFCAFEYTEEFSLFAAKAAEQIDCVKADPWISDDVKRDDLLYMTAIPWVSFTSFMHAINFPVDSMPRFAWGKFYEDGESLKMPLSVQIHHALADGIHVGRFYEAVQDHLSNPYSLLSVT
ncbi:MAG: chloramphenicol acetyltransferase [Chloroflexota bacterium]|nr:MAG: chloramphenicol acetyltransferase [Chloroflexota bacterium]